jgi:hypothetical protein
MDGRLLYNRENPDMSCLMYMNVPFIFEMEMNETKYMNRTEKKNIIVELLSNAIIILVYCYRKENKQYFLSLYRSHICLKLCMRPFN